SGTVAIERDDTIALFWFFDLKARVAIAVDAETGAIDVDLPWWAKLSGKSDAARSLESLDPKAVKAALADTRPARSAVRMLLLVDGAYRGDLNVDAAGAIRFATSSPSVEGQ
ncbi:MAG TPA: hypothetical protein VLB83_04410, partial [Candidatus Paceibacterota bacterium]|nr:hypothetical protein [Candidatus Paceibacterota bacterium]